MGKTIFVLDDSELVLAAVQAALAEQGHRVRTAIDLAGLETSCAEEAPDLVVLDVQMPEALGDDVGRVLRGIRGIQAPILLFSSLPEPRLAERVAEAGLDGYVSKDHGVAALVARIAAILER